MGIIEHINSSRKEGRRLLAQLIDPDDVMAVDVLLDLAAHAEKVGVDYFLLGGSMITAPQDFDVVRALKAVSSIPIITFPSSPAQLHADADGILFLSLISGRNPEFLIGHHVTAAPLLRKMNTEVIPTGYMLVACGDATTAEYVSNSMPIPYNKPNIAAATALAGQMLGLKMIYLDAGSGADRPVSAEMVRAVRSWIEVPLVVGGGIRSSIEAAQLTEAGADMLVVGNGVWKNPELLSSLCTAINKV